MLPDEIVALLRHQDGVVSRAQLLAVGVASHDIVRWQRRRELNRIHPGVYVEHTGVPTARQLAWAAVLACGRAGLWGESAVRAHEGSFEPIGGRPVLVAVDESRTVRAPSGVRVRRVDDLQGKVQWHRRPPTQPYDEALIEMVAGRGVRLRRTERVAVLAGALQQRRTTGERLLAALAFRANAHDRDWLTSVLRDLTAGSHSVLELTYATDVERAHGLPVSQRQRRDPTRSGVVYRDNAYDDGFLVELDGGFHATPGQRARDLERDLDAALDGLATIRLGWSQVVDHPCATAGKVARLLVLRGWTGRPQPCSPGCTVLATFQGRAA